MLSNVTYAAMKVNPKAAEFVSHSNGYCQAVTIPNEEIIFLKPALEEGHLYGFSAKLSKMGGYQKTENGKLLFNHPVEFRIPVCDDLAEVVQLTRKAWCEAYEGVKDQQ